MTGHSIFTLRLGGLGLRPPRNFASFIIEHIVSDYRQNNTAQIPCPVLIYGGILTRFVHEDFVIWVHF